MHVQRLGYLVIESTNLDAWRQFGNEILGMALGQRAGADALHIRMDDQPFRIAVIAGAEDRLQYSGWQLANQAALDELTNDLAANGVAVERVDRELAKQRCVGDLVRVTDPGGAALELYCSPILDHEVFVSPAGVSGFVTGALGLGHVVMLTPTFDESLAFYTQRLGFKESDSMMLDETAGSGVLVGKPAVQGKGPRSYRLTGRRIELGLERREVRLIKALGAGQATGADWRLTADTIHLRVDRRKLQQLFAWGDSSRPHAISSLHTIQADSLALDLPDEALTEARAFRKARSTSQRDSTPRGKGEQDWIAGDTIVAHWRHPADSAAKPELDRLVARGTARALTHLRNERDSTRRAPSVNYTRGSVIEIALKGDRIDQVHATGPADGLHLEPLPPVDSTKTKRAKRPGAAP